MKPSTGEVVDEKRQSVYLLAIGAAAGGGYIALGSMRECREAVKQLKGKSDFPNVRIVKGMKNAMYNVMHNVRWGEPEPKTHDDVKIGKFYGYSQNAIARYKLN